MSTTEQQFDSLCNFAEKGYDISFQIWGRGRYTIYIEKNDVDLWSMGGFETPHEAMKEALRYLRRIYKTKQ